MSITDELRGFANSGMSAMECSAYSDKLIDIADRIDAEHERAIADAYLSGTPTDEKLTELGWIRLPKDADGEVIRIGDKLIDEDDKPQKPAIVKCILYNDEGCVVSDIDPRGCWYDPSLLRHYHAPTVEDMLREFTDAILD